VICVSQPVASTEQARCIVLPSCLAPELHTENVSNADPARSVLGEPALVGADEVMSRPMSVK